MDPPSRGHPPCRGDRKRGLADLQSFRCIITSRRPSPNRTRVCASSRMRCRTMVNGCGLLLSAGPGAKIAPPLRHAVGSPYNAGTLCVCDLVVTARAGAGYGGVHRRGRASTPMPGTRGRDPVLEQAWGRTARRVPRPQDAAAFSQSISEARSRARWTRAATSRSPGISRKAVRPYWRSRSSHRRGS